MVNVKMYLLLRLPVRGSQWRTHQRKLVIKLLYNEVKGDKIIEFYKIIEQEFSTSQSGPIMGSWS